MRSVSSPEDMNSANDLSNLSCSFSSNWYPLRNVFSCSEVTFWNRRPKTIIIQKYPQNYKSVQSTRLLSTFDGELCCGRPTILNADLKDTQLTLATLYFIMTGLAASDVCCGNLRFSWRQQPPRESLREVITCHIWYTVLSTWQNSLRCQCGRVKHRMVNPATSSDSHLYQEQYTTT